MTEKEFRDKYRQEKCLYQAWGEYVKSIIVNQLYILGETEDIFKLPVIPRLKEEDSIVAKAFYRGKTYKNPYDDITDKIGIRFVVLTADKIDMIKSIIENEKQWEYSEDVDYKRNIIEKPELFTYQSVHYIVRPKYSFNINCGTIPVDMPCEIQIRTLLQHAYAELSHDTVYKKENEISAHIKRLLARSMALIETTDSLFMEVYDVLLEEDSMYTQFNKLIKKHKIFDNVTEDLNKFIFTSYKIMIDSNSITLTDIDKFICSRGYLKDNISAKEQWNIIYRQPVIFLLFYLIKNFRNQMLDNWPLEESLLSPIFTDLGESIDL